MTIEQYWAKLKSHGFTPHKIGDGYIILVGSEGQRVGIPCPDNLSPDQRVEEMSVFLKTHMLN